jgi:hypothetical protein
MLKLKFSLPKVFKNAVGEFSLETDIIIIIIIILSLLYFYFCLFRFKMSVSFG